MLDLDALVGFLIRKIASTAAQAFFAISTPKNFGI